jgi:hypothetical protein
MPEIPTIQQRRDKAERTNTAAVAAIEAERLAREKKTARLRALRLANEAREREPWKQPRGGSR